MRGCSEGPIYPKPARLPGTPPRLTAQRPFPAFKKHDETRAADISGAFAVTPQSDTVPHECAAFGRDGNALLTPQFRGGGQPCRIGRVDNCTAAGRKNPHPPFVNCDAQMRGAGRMWQNQVFPSNKACYRTDSSSSGENFRSTGRDKSRASSRSFC